jgi:hypothetical protein
MRRATVILLSLAAVLAACSDDKGTGTPSVTTGKAELQKHESELRRAFSDSVNAFLDGDSDAFYDSFSAGFQARCEKKEFEKIIALASVFLGDIEEKDRKIEITDVSFEEDRAHVAAKVDLGGNTSIDDDEGDLTDYWVLEDGKWKADTDDKTPCDLGGTISGGDGTDETPATGPGTSRGEAVAPGQPVTTGDLRVAVTSVDLDAADTIAAEDDFPETPEAGNRFVLIRVRAEHTGQGEETVSVSSTNFEITGSRNVLYDGFSQSTSCGFIDDEIRGELFAGGSVEGYVCFQLPADETDLILVVSPQFSFADNDRRYLALE